MKFKKKIHVSFSIRLLFKQFFLQNNHKLSKFFLNKKEQQYLILSKILKQFENDLLDILKKKHYVFYIITNDTHWLNKLRSGDKIIFNKIIRSKLIKHDLELIEITKIINSRIITKFFVKIEKEQVLFERAYATINSVTYLNNITVGQFVNMLNWVKDEEYRNGDFTRLNNKAKDLIVNLREKAPSYKDKIVQPNM